jgi:hypothetical protein
MIPPHLLPWDLLKDRALKKPRSTDNLKRNITNEIAAILPAKRAITLAKMGRFSSQAQLNQFLHFL